MSACCTFTPISDRLTAAGLPPIPQAPIRGDDRAALTRLWRGASRVADSFGTRRRSRALCRDAAGLLPHRAKSPTLQLTRAFRPWRPINSSITCRVSPRPIPPARRCLDNVHLSFYPDAKIGVLGINGSGKSTLLRIMAGIDTEYHGRRLRRRGRPRRLPAAGAAARRDARTCAATSCWASRPSRPSSTATTNSP